MRAILISVLLIIVAIAVYNATIGGEGGMKSQLNQSGNTMNERIRQMSP